MHLPSSLAPHHWLNSFLPRTEPAPSGPAKSASLRILFFPPGHDWEGRIRAGFASTAHEIAFADFTPDNIRQYDLIVPLTIAGLYLLNGFGEAVRKNPIPIPSPESVALCDDKLLLNRTLIASGFGRNIPRLGSGQRYPYMLKKRVDTWGKNSHIITGPADEAALAGKISDPDYFCQECIPGCNEYSTHIVCRDGRIVRSLTLRLRFDQETFIRGRDTDRTRAACDCRFLDLFEQILGTIGLDGLCCFNYKIFKCEAQIFEINPRFGASLAPLFAEFIDYLGSGENGQSLIAPNPASSC